MDESLPRTSTAPVILAVRLALSGEFTLETREWLLKSIQRIVLDDAPLEVAFRMSSGACIAARDQALRHAAALLAERRRDALSTWKQANYLMAEIKRFNRVTRGRVQNGFRPEDPVDAALGDAFLCGAKWPKSEKQLQRILETN